MNLFSLLSAAVDITLLEQGYRIGLDWLGQFARVIIECGAGIGVGIILFTLVLKAITLPFDIYQRVKMRKQNLVMRNMQPELEKLQKQYANDKNMYNQKMMELQKKNGIGILTACLPMIISLVILIVAFQGFRSYSQYANLKSYADMSESFNAAILENGVEGLDISLAEKEGTTYNFKWTEDGEDKTMSTTWTPDTVLMEKDGITYTMSEIKSEDGTMHECISVKGTGEKSYMSYYYYLDTLERHDQIETDKLLAVLNGLPAEEKDEVVQAAIDAITAYENEATDENETARRVAVQAYVRRVGAIAAAEEFRNNPPKFLWIKNVWYPDVSYNHPIPDYNTFKSQLNKNVTLANGEVMSITKVLGQDDYGYLTQELTAERGAANGYFILIVLSIGLMLLSQWVTMRSSKEANKYQTVDGQGERTQKIMLVVMPLIYAVFSFTMSAAFSIYMVMSSLVSLLVTIISNFFIGRIFNKKEEEAFRAEHSRELPWMKNKKDKKSKK